MSFDKRDLDRYITGNWGEDQYRDDVPEEAYCSACVDTGDPNCAVCKGSGIDPVRLAEYEAHAKAEAQAEYEAWAESDKEEA